MKVKGTQSFMYFLVVMSLAALNWIQHFSVYTKEYTLSDNSRLDIMHQEQGKDQPAATNSSALIMKGGEGAPDTSIIILDDPVVEREANQTTKDAAPTTPGDLSVRIHDQSDHEQHRKATVYVLRGSGLGSQLVNMLCYQMHLDRVEDRSIIVDESCYSYRKNETVGVLTGFFTPAMTVVDHPPDRVSVLREYGVQTYHVNKHCRVHAKAPNSLFEVMQHDNPLAFVSLLSHGMYFRRNILFQHFPGQDLDHLYRLLSSYACQSLHFNPEAKDAIKKIKQKAGLSPAFLDENNDTTSVTFHVRRSDKVTSGESKKYTGDDYVRKLLDEVGSSHASNMTHCFVATDDYAVVEELSESLQRHNISCHLETLAPKNRHGTSGHMQKAISHGETIEFLAELSIAIDSTYFIGTFNSNVGSLVTLLRSCKASSKPDSGYHNYFRSYGVDQKKWVIP